MLSRQRLLEGADGDLVPGRSASTSSSSFAAGAVARIRAGSDDSTIISTRGAGLAMSIGTYAQSALSTPSSATIAAGHFGTNRQTRSPRTQPASRSRRASRFPASSSSPYVSRSSPMTTATASGRASA